MMLPLSLPPFVCQMCSFHVRLIFIGHFENFVRIWGKKGKNDDEVTNQKKEKEGNKRRHTAFSICLFVKSSTVSHLTSHTQISTLNANQRTMSTSHYFTKRFPWHSKVCLYLPPTQWTLAFFYQSTHYHYLLLWRSSEVTLYICYYRSYQLII